MSLLIEPLLTFSNVSTVLLSGFMKIPQIYSIVKSKSVVGLSLTGLLLELTGYSIITSYNMYSGYALESYFEYPLLVVQDIVMLAIFLTLVGLLSPFVLPVAGLYSAFMFAIAAGYLPDADIKMLVGLCTPLSASSKILQLLTIFRSKDSSTISVSTWTIAAYTCITRLFTTYVESADSALMINFAVSLALNVAIVFTAIIYRPKIYRKED